MPSKSTAAQQASKTTVMVRRRKVSGLSTGEMLGIGGAVLVIGYLLMKKTTTTTTPVATTTYIPAGSSTAITNPYAAQAQETTAIANSASSVINSFINALN
jgi:hypothetical protein